MDIPGIPALTTAMYGEGGSPTLDDVAGAVFDALDIALDDGLSQHAIDHMTTVGPVGEHGPHEQRLHVGGVTYQIIVRRWKA